MKTSAPASAASAVPCSPRGFVSSAYSALTGESPGRPRWTIPSRSQPVTSSIPGGEQHLRDGDAGCAHARDHDPHALESLADDLERVVQRGEDDHRGPVLVVVEDGDVELLAQPLLDLEAARRGDVLEVDSPEDGRVPLVLRVLRA